MKNNIVLLKKDGSIDVTKKESKILDKGCKYVLIPVTEYDTNTFIFIKPNELLDFDWAEIEVIMQHQSFDSEKGVDYGVELLHPINKKVTSIVDLINFIHSIDRIDYVNYVSNNRDYYGYINIIDIAKLSIRIIKDNTVIYSFDYKAKYGEGFDGKSNCEEVVQKLKDLYIRKNSDLQTKKGNLYLNIKHNKWSINDYIKDNAIIGINLVVSQSVYFIEKDIYNLFSKISSIDSSGYIYNLDIVDTNLIQDYDIPRAIQDLEIEVSSDFYFREETVEYFIEYILYMRMIFAIIIMEFNMIIFGVNVDLQNRGFDMNLEINFYGRCHKNEFTINFRKDKIITMDKMIQLLIEKEV